MHISTPSFLSLSLFSLPSRSPFPPSLCKTDRRSRARREQRRAQSESLGRRGQGAEERREERARRGRRGRWKRRKRRRKERRGRSGRCSTRCEGGGARPLRAATSGAARYLPTAGPISAYRKSDICLQQVRYPPSASPISSYKPCHLPPNPLSPFEPRYLPMKCAIDLHTPTPLTPQAFGCGRDGSRRGGGDGEEEDGGRAGGAGRGGDDGSEAGEEGEEEGTGAEAVPVEREHRLKLRERELEKGSLEAVRP
eukprot:3789752-Rhodomonas_salina.1